MPLEFVLATANADKAREIAEIVGPSVTLLPRPASVPDVEETEETLLANARLKAPALVAATGRAALADDTGLEVDDLGGAPGVYSARYAGEKATYADNVAKLLAPSPTSTVLGGPGSGRSRWPSGRTVGSGRRRSGGGHHRPRSPG